MFSKNYLIMVLFVGSLFSSDNTPKKGLFDSHAIVKKFVVPGLVGIAVAVLSEKAVFLGPDARYLDGASENLDYLLTFGNLKVICIILSQGTFSADKKKIISPGIISVENGQRICTLISGLHGLAAAAVCRYGLNRFFPG